MTRIERTQERILAFHQATGRWPTASAHRPSEERSMAVAFLRHVTSYPDFAEKVRQLGWVSRNERVAERKAAILSFREAQRRWPSPSGTTEEAALAKAFACYVCPSHSSFDPAFTRDVLKRGYSPREDSAIWKQFPSLKPAFFGGPEQLRLKEEAAA